MINPRELRIVSLINGAPYKHLQLDSFALPWMAVYTTSRPLMPFAEMLAFWILQDCELTCNVESRVSVEACRLECRELGV